MFLGYKLIILYLLTYYVGKVHTQCTLPLSDGTWESSTRGTWTVSSSGTVVGNFKADLSQSLTTATLTCAQAGNTDTQYILTTSFELFFQLFIDVYTCIDIRTTDQSPSSYIYYIVTPTDTTTGEEFTSDLSSACTASDYTTAIKTHVLVQSGSESGAVANCPNVILGNYSVSYSDIDSAAAADGSTLDSCSNTTALNFVNADTSKKIAFADSTFLQCIHTVTSDSNYYVHTYNNDTTVDSSTTYRFACWIFAYSDTGVTATVFPESCHQDQSSTSVQYGGEVFTFTPYATCPITAAESSSGLAAWIIVLIVLAVIVFIILLAILIAWLVLRRSRNRPSDEEKEIVKNERQPSPDSIPDEDLVKKKLKEQSSPNKSRKGNILFRKKEDGYDSGFEEKGLNKDPFKLKDKTIREHTFDLTEVKKEKSNKLQEGQPIATNRSEPLPILTPKGKGPLLTNRTEPVRSETKKGKGTISFVQQETDEKQKENVREIELIHTLEPVEGKKSTPPTKPVDDKKSKPTTKPVDEKISVPPTKPADGRKLSIPPTTPKSVDGKLSIPPTTPKVIDDDNTLVRIRKEREKKEKEREDKKKKEEESQTKKKEKEKRLTELKNEKVSKVKRESSSSGEYETDESEREERIQKLIEKRKRLAGATYEPPDDIFDANVVGRKKRRKKHEVEDLTKSLVSREQQEKMDRERKERKKALKKIAKKKFRPETLIGSSSDSDKDSKSKRHKKRKVGDSSGAEAPFMEQYHTKKDIEEELDQNNFWNTDPPVASAFELSMEELAKAKAKDDSKSKATIKVAPVDANKQDDKSRPKSKLEVIMQEDEDVWDHVNNRPLPGKLGVEGFDFGPNGELPEGFIRDKDGNIVRESDGKLVASGELARQLEMRRKLNVFGLPRLVRNDEGRPLGGYKDDEFGPTAEWDFGDTIEPIVTEEEVQQTEPPSAALGKQVAFSDNKSVPETPITELDYNQKKGRQIGSADQRLLKERLFEQQQKRKPETEHEKSVPVYFVGKKGVKPDSVYIDTSQVARQDQPQAFQRSQSLRTSAPAGNSVVRSDTFNDGRRNMQRNSKLRSSLTGPRDAIPEEPDKQNVGNLGSDDEFILVGGSMKKLNRPPDNPDVNLPVNLCHRLDRQGVMPSREMSDMSMRTAPDTQRPFSGDDRRLRRLLGELYKDKKYFDYYLETEELPTNAAVETRGLADHGRSFLMERAEFWGENEPVVERPPPSELAMRLSRMHTMMTIADSGLDSRMSTNLTDRPHSADDAQNAQPQSVRRESTHREGTREAFTVDHQSTSRSNTKTSIPLSTERSDRLPPTGRSEAAKSPTKVEQEKKDGSKVTTLTAEQSNVTDQKNSNNVLSLVDS